MKSLPATTEAPAHAPSATVNRRGGWRSVQIVEGFQARFILTNLCYLAASLLAVALALFARPAWVLLTRPPGPSTTDTAATFLLLHAVAWPTLLAVLALSALHLTVTTHKVAGPLVRFRRVFEQMAAGNFRGPVSLRKGDYLMSEAALLSSALAALAQRDGQCRLAIEHAEAAVTMARSARHPEGLADALALAARELEAARALLPGATAEHAAAGKAPLRLVPGSEHAAGDLPRRGFTLVEILIVLALICVLGAMAYPRYLQALDAARVARAIGDINALGKDISVFHVLNGRLPRDLAEVGEDSRRDPWGHPYEYLPLDGSVVVASNMGSGPAPEAAPTGGQGRGGGQAGSGAGAGGASGGGGGGAGGVRGQARKDRNLVPINSDFDLYSKGRDGESVPPLTARVSADDVIRASSGGFIGLASNY